MQVKLKVSTILKFIILALILSLYIFITKIQKPEPTQQKEVERQELKIEKSEILNSNGTPTKNLLNLLTELKIEHDGTLAGIVNVTQKEWLRPAGKERWEVTGKYINQKDILLPLLTNLRLIGDIKPTQSFYDYALMLGAITTTSRQRLANLISQWQQGVRFKKLIFLAGQRPLNPEIESKEILLDKDNKHLPFRKDWKFNNNLPKTETEMMRLIFDQADLPEEMKKVEVVFVDAPMKKDAQGNFVRPTTPDTINEWLKTNPLPGSCLAISNQPYVGYQNSTLKTILPPTFTVETIGKKVAIQTIKIPVILDALARWLYQEQKRIIPRSFDPSISLRSQDKSLRSDRIGGTK